MKILKFLIHYILILCLATACFYVKDIRVLPYYDEVDPQFSGYVDEWLFLAKNNNIKFTKTVNIGFKRINIDGVVGLCHYQHFFREIDIDPIIWGRLTDISKTVLIWHELTHCYCYRDHDYAEGKEYSSATEGEPKEKILGYYPDKCPLSIMSPVIIEDSCFIAHFVDYQHEQFDRCKPY